jgi:hypothetical protein
MSPRTRAAVAEADLNHEIASVSSSRNLWTTTFSGSPVGTRMPPIDSNLGILTAKIYRIRQVD